MANRTMGMATPAPKPKTADPWQQESDHRTMSDAAEIQGDQSRMAGVKQFHAKKMGAMNKLSKSMGMKKGFGK